MVSPELVPNLVTIECMMGQHQPLCVKLGHNLHELMPPRVKIVAPLENQDSKDVLTYSYTSPIRSEFVLRKLLRFTVPESVIPYEGSDLISDLSRFDDVKLHGNVIFALVSNDERVIANYKELAEEYRERFYFFQAPSSTQESYILAVGNNFTRRFEVG